MATKELAELLRQQIEAQKQQQEEQLRLLDEQKEAQRQQLEEQKKLQQDQMQMFLTTLQSLGANVKPEIQAQPMPNPIAIPPFSAYDPSTELWSDY